MKSLHLITGLNVGGAEMMLFKVSRGLLLSKSNPEVLALSGGPLETKFSEVGIPVETLGLSRGSLPSLKTILKLFKKVKSFSPDVIQGWMYHGNLAATVAAFFIKNKVVVWNIRQTLYNTNNEKKLTKFVIWLNIFLSRSADVIIYNSQTSADQHVHLGFEKSKTVIIPNGFDTSVFFYSEESKAKIRAELGISKDKIVIGHVARFHPMKNHSLFVKTAIRLTTEFPEKLCFIMVGEGISISNPEFQNLNGNDNFHLLGARRDIPDVTNSFDIATLTSSWGEAFPNTIGEAMACEVPCVASDVGDVKIILGNGGFVTPVDDEELFYEALKKMILLSSAERRAIGKDALARVKEQYSIEKVVESYRDLYQKLSLKK